MKFLHWVNWQFFTYHNSRHLPNLNQNTLEYLEGTFFYYVTRIGEGLRTLWQNLTLHKAFVGFCVTIGGTADSRIFIESCFLIVTRSGQILFSLNWFFKNFWYFCEVSKKGVSILDNKILCWSSKNKKTRKITSNSINQCNIWVELHFDNFLEDFLTYFNSRLY